MELKVLLIRGKQFPPHQGHIPEPCPPTVYTTDVLCMYVISFLHWHATLLVLTIMLQVTVVVSFGVKLIFISNSLVYRRAAASWSFMVCWSITVNIDRYKLSALTAKIQSNVLYPYPMITDPTASKGN